MLQVEDAIQIFEFKHPEGCAVFIFDCSAAHESYAEDALIAHKMNKSPGGQQPKMHNTIIPSGLHQGEVQTMVFADDSPERDKNGVSLAGKPKGMERILAERGLLETLAQGRRGKVVSVCAECKKSQEARDRAAKEAKARRDEIEGSGLPLMADRSECQETADDLDRPSNCCMRRLLSMQPDFASEKPLLQLLIEKAGHKCLFLPKFHCELNPIEMVWGQAKRCECSLMTDYSICLTTHSRFP